MLTCQQVVCIQWFVCRSWLREAGLAVLAPDETAALMDNPLRNGLLLCDLAGQLATHTHSALASLLVTHMYLHYPGDTPVLALFW